MSNRGIIYEDIIGRGKSVSSARRYGGIVERFEECCGVKNDYNRGDVVKFIAGLRESGMKQNSINSEMEAIKLLCIVQKWKDGWPRLNMNKVRRCDIRRTIFSYEDIGNIIRKGKRVCSEREIAFIAAATTYGLRRGEIGNLEVKDGTVKVNTLKGGEVTIHLVPSRIKNFMNGYHGCNDPRYMSRVFSNIIDKVGVEVGIGYGWHSIRRALATELLECDVKMLNVLRFMRWSEGSMINEVGMLAIYGRRKQADVDMSIFKVHPYLGFW